MPAPQVIQSLADAIGGVDREASFRKGMAERADIDSTQAQTEAALQLARDRRLDAQRKEREAAAQEALREQLANLPPGSTDQSGLDPFNVMASGFGDEYAGQQLGRSRAQEYNLKETIAAPSMGMGDELDQVDPALSHEYDREAALEALAPSSAIASRRMDPSVVPVLQPDGSSIWVQRPQSPGQAVGAPPSRAGGAAANAGGLSSAVSGLIFRQSSALFGGTYDPLSGRFGGLDREAAENVQRLASRASVIFKAGGVDPQTAVDQALDEMQKASQAGTEIPPQFGEDLAGGDEFEGQTATGPNGEKVVWRNGQWGPAQ